MVRNSGKLSSLQAGRAIAATMVVLFHARFIVTEQITGPSSIWGIFRSGDSGVEFFFVLSGFLMAAVHWGDFGQPLRLGRYLIKRFARIYPPYWIALAFLILGQLAILGLEPRLTNPLTLLCDVLLIPSPGSPALTVSWTLMHEMMFYLIFGLLIANLRIGASVFLFWQICVVLAGLWQLGGGSGPGFPMSFLLSPLNLLFGMGMTASVVAARLTPRAAIGLAVAGIGFFVWAAWYAAILPDGRAREVVSTWWYGAAAAMGVAGFAAWERHGSLKIPKVLTYLGDASYSIYLVHAPAMMVAAIVLNKLGGNETFGSWPVFAALVLVGMAAGIVFYQIFEKPMLKILQRRINRRRSKLASDM